MARFRRLVLACTVIVKEADVGVGSGGADVVGTVVEESGAMEDDRGVFDKMQGHVVLVSNMVEMNVETWALVRVTSHIHAKPPFQTRSAIVVELLNFRLQLRRRVGRRTSL